MSTALSHQEIYERIYAAISQRRLLPGTKLSEECLAQTFHTSRSRIREVLMRLSQELVIELRANRGAFVACLAPTGRYFYSNGFNQKTIIALIPAAVIGFACNRVPLLAAIFANFSIFIAGGVAGLIYWAVSRSGVGIEAVAYTAKRSVA